VASAEIRAWKPRKMRWQRTCNWWYSAGLFLQTFRGKTLATCT